MNYKRAITVVLCFIFGLLIPPGSAPGDSDFDNELIKQKTDLSALRIGKSAVAAQLQGSVLLIDPDLQATVEELVSTASRAADCGIEPRVYLINSEVVNAVAYSSGDIIIYSGLLDIMENLDELAFVVGHEVAHLCAGHSLKQMKERYKIVHDGLIAARIITNAVAAAAGGAVSGALSTVPAVYNNPYLHVRDIELISQFAARIAGTVSILVSSYAILASQHAYSREQELEADEMALKYMHTAGFHLGAADDVIVKLEESRDKINNEK